MATSFSNKESTSTPSFPSGVSPLYDPTSPCMTTSSPKTSTARSHAMQDNSNGK